MRTFAGKGLAVGRRSHRGGWPDGAHPENQTTDKGRDQRLRQPIPDHVSAVLEIEAADHVLPSADQPTPIPARLLAGLRADPLLGLADVRLVQHIQPIGVGLPERSQARASYQSLNQDVARRLGTDPVPAACQT